jgi:DNA-binding CsgD family transcriptional regulator
VGTATVARVATPCAVTPLAAGWGSVLAQTADAIGAEDFYSRLIESTRTLIPADFCIVARYRRSTRPRILIDGGMGRPARSSYMADLWRLDPIGPLVEDSERIRAVSLEQLRQSGGLSESYCSYLDTELGVTDELAILLPGADRNCLALCLDRRGHPFRPEEVELARELQVLFTTLNDKHVGTDIRRFGEDRSLPASRPRPPVNDEELEEALDDFRRRHGLTRRETDILALALQGHPNTSIAQRLGISIGVVKNHKHRLYNKLDITTERELITTFFAEQRAM